MEKRKRTREIKIGNLILGGDNPILIQSMCNIKTSKVEEVAAQINRCASLGADLMRLSVLDEDDARSFKAIKSYEIRNSNKKETEKIIKNEGGINPYNYHRPKEKKVSDEVDKLRRLEKAFSKKEPNLHFNMNKFSLNSKLIDNLLKYSNEKYRNLILSERIIQNYREREKQEINENLDI